MIRKFAFVLATLIVSLTANSIGIQPAPVQPLRLFLLAGQSNMAGRGVSSDGLVHKGDRVHFDSASARELGRRYAEAYRALAPPPAQPQATREGEWRDDVEGPTTIFPPTM